jgi:hypothetical protein
LGCLAGDAGRVIRLPYLGGKIRGVFASGKEEAFVLVGCMESSAEQEGWAAILCRAFFSPLFYFLRGKENKV